MANRRFNQFYNTLHKMPVQLDCNFVVDHSNGNGLGIRSLKGAGIIDVFMNTSATPAKGNSGLLNPNPAAGYIMVVFEDNYQYYIGGYAGFVSPVSGTPILVTTGTTAGLAYTIVTVGTTTIDQWQKLGLPVGITPAVGASFIAIATTTATGTGAIEVPATAHSGVQHIEVIGDPNQTIISGIGASPMTVPVPYIISACMSTNTLTAPADNTVIGMNFYFQNSSIVNQGY